MRSQLRISVATLFALLAALAVFAPGAMADENDNGCKDPGQVNGTSNLVEAEVTTSGNESTYTFKSADQGGDKGIPGLISYCVFPGAQPDEHGVTVDETAGTGAQGWNLTFFNDPPTFSSFSFNRDNGNESNIPLDGSTRTMGTAVWSGGAPAAADQAVTLHINDEAECEALGENSETCWVLPGTIGKNPPALDLTATKTAEPSFEREFKWELEKNADKSRVEMAEGEVAEVEYTITVRHNEGTDGGWKVIGEITVTNPNSGPVSGVEVEDAIYKGVGEVDGNAECEVEEGTGGVEIEGESTHVFDYTCTYTGAPENSTEETNIAVVTWPEQTVEGHLLDEGEAEAEEKVDWAATEPTLIDDEFNVEDSVEGFLGTANASEANPIEFTYTGMLEGVPGECTKYENVATGTTNINEVVKTDEATVEVCVGVDLKVSKTAEPSFKRKFPWSLEKTVDKEEVKTTGKTATFNYTINVTKGEGEDSDWVVKGKITVENPNDWESITVDVADEIEADTGAECSVVNGENVEIAESGSEVFEYECIYKEKPAATEETNKATATWDSEAAHTPSGEASGTAEVNWGGVKPATTDNCVTEVTDTVDGTTTKLEGELCESKTFEETISYKVESGCTEHTNVAQATTVDSKETLKDEVTVRVCGPVESGALTMGYWQNKNGQSIITGGKSTAGVCNAATWLLQFPPFQGKELGSSATCKKLAEYVTSVIKAANAGGAAMNAMLKGQMLATALDVYFSDPALGDNKIKAPSPIGSLNIDLTQVCKNIPSCTKFENTSAAFGGAKSKTVMELLTYAASKSNVGGSTWYNQVKATQELAKDTFDAINNEVAFEA